MAALTCPIDQGKLVPLKGKEAAMVLFQKLVDPKSGVAGMMEGALNRHINGQIQRCDTCRFIAIFDN